VVSNKKGMALVSDLVMFGMVFLRWHFLCLQICLPTKDFFQGTVHWFVHMAPSDSMRRAMLPLNGRTMAHFTSLFHK
jgi:hypothetical protein